MPNILERNEKGHSPSFSSQISPTLVAAEVIVVVAVIVVLVCSCFNLALLFKVSSHFSVGTHTHMFNFTCYFCLVSSLTKRNTSSKVIG